LINVIIWDAKGFPPLDDSKIVLWSSFPDEKAPNSVSIPILVEECAENLRARYLAWVYDLGSLTFDGRTLIEHFRLSPGFSYWWMMLISEGNLGKSPQITNAIRFLAFIDWLRENPAQKLTLLSDNKALADCISELCNNYTIQFEWKRPTKKSILKNITLPNRLYQALPLFFKSLIWITIYISERWCFRGIGLKAWKDSENRITLFSYLLNFNHQAAKNGSFESLYWGPLPQILKEENSEANWLHIYVRDPMGISAKEVAKSLRNLNKFMQGKSTHVALETFLSFKIIVKALISWFSLMFKGSKNQKLIHNRLKKSMKTNLWPLFVDDFRQSIYGPVGIANMFTYHLTSAAMDVQKIRAGIFLQENQGWEFCLIQLWRSAGHGFLIGYPHSTVRFWDTRYFYDSRIYSSSGDNALPLPDFVALHGKASYDSYVDGGYPVSDLISVEALRYLYLEEINLRARTFFKQPSNEVRLLVLGDYSEEVTRFQMQMLEKAFQNFPLNASIIIKSHPACPIKANDYPLLPMKITTEPVSQLLSACNVVLCSNSTSAGLEAYYLDIPVLCVLDPKTPNLSPLRGFSGVFFVSSPKNLFDSFFEINSKNFLEFRGQKEIFTIVPDAPRWRKILKYINSDKSQFIGHY
jgi:surface carbohydrate biosynthesis protein (TIGR04326 family)